MFCHGRGDIRAVFFSLLLILLAAWNGNAQDNQQKPPGIPIEVLSDTHGADFKPYLAQVLQAVRENWYQVIPQEARPPENKRGEVSIEFSILKDGKIAGMKLTNASGDVALDRAAWGGITASVAFAPLPEEFHGPFLTRRFHFYYNPPKT